MPRQRDDAWHEVTTSVADLRDRMAEHYRRHASTRGEVPEEFRGSVTGTLDGLARQAGSAVEAVGDAVRDEQVRESALRASRALADAAEASVIELTRELRQAGDRFRNRPR
ncbi:MAG: hypothetical protein ABSA40_02925 [Candidatus Dormibacteria bacterium]|jgi:hypothetical protein